MVGLPKASNRIDVTVAGTVTVVNEVSTNACIPIDVTALGKVNVVKLLQPEYL